MSEIERPNVQNWLKKVIEDVVSRQNDDGGYTFCQGAESNAQDAFYGLSVLTLLKEEIPNPTKTLDFLNESRHDSITATYSVTKFQLQLGKGINEKFKKRIRSIINSRNYFGIMTRTGIDSQYVSHSISSVRAAAAAGTTKTCWGAVHQASGSWNLRGSKSAPAKIAVLRPC